MKILKLFLFIVSSLLYSQIKDSIVFQPHFQLGKAYHLEINSTFDGYGLADTKLLKIFSEIKRDVEISFFQKLGNDFLFKLKIKKIESISSVENKNYKGEIKLPEVEIIFKLDSTGTFAGVINKPSIYDKLTKLKRQDIKKKNINAELHQNIIFNEINNYDSYIEFFLMYNNIQIYKGKSYFTNVRKKPKGFPMKEIIDFSENNDNYILRTELVLENQNLLPIDFKPFFSVKFATFEIFKNEYHSKSESTYIYDKFSQLPLSIEQKSESTVDCEGKMNYETRTIKILN